MEETTEQSAPMAGSMSQKELREARRRRILERGGDRLKYITGEVKTLPPAASTSEPSQLQNLAEPPKAGEMALKSHSNPGELPALVSTSEEASAGTSFDAKDISQKLSNVQTELRSLNTLQFESPPTPLPVSITTTALFTPQRPYDLDTLATPNTAESFTTWQNLSYAALSKSIDHTVVFRAILACLLGVFFVTLWTYSQCKHPYESLNYIPRWPVSLLIITDVTVVVGAFLLGFVKLSQVPDKPKISHQSGLAVFRESRLDQILAMSSQLEGALDFGLLLTKASTGLVADISIYLVTIVCAVSVGDYFGPSLCGYISR